MSEPQEGASGETDWSTPENKQIIWQVLHEEMMEAQKHKMAQVEMLAKAASIQFEGIPVICGKKEVVDDIRSKVIRELEVQVEKLRVRRDSWRERYEQARADLAEHQQGREVLADIIANDHNAKQLRRERDEARDMCKRERRMRLGLEALVVIAVSACIAYELARAVLG